MGKALGPKNRLIESMIDIRIFDAIAAEFILALCYCPKRAAKIANLLTRSILFLWLLANDES
jgi:hypothetical protein